MASVFGVAKMNPATTLSSVVWLPNSCGALFGKQLVHLGNQRALPNFPLLFRAHRAQIANELGRPLELWRGLYVMLEIKRYLRASCLNNRLTWSIK